jgi:hypothetical protein
MWAEDIDEISVEYEEDGVQRVKQEDKVIVARGGWPVIVFLYREWDEATQAFGPAKITLRKYRKQHGTYRQESKFNIGNLTQAAAISEVLSRWAPKTAAE